MRKLYSFVFIFLAIPSFLFCKDVLKPNFFKGSFDEARELAQKEGKLFMISFYADWCTPCNWMDETTFADSVVQSLLDKNYISFKVDIDDIEGFKLKEKYELKYLPTILIFNTQSKLLLRIEETLSPTQMIQALERYNSEENKKLIVHAVNSSPLEHKEFNEMLSENTDTASENENNANTSINEPAIEKVKENVTLIFLPESLSVLENKSKDQIQNGSKIMAIDTSSSVLGSSAQITLIDSLQNSDTENKPSAITNEVPIENTNTSNENSIGESLAESDESNVSSVLADESDDNTIQGNTPYDDEDSLGNFEYEKKVEPQYKLQIGVFSQFRNTYKLVNELKEKFPEPVIVLNDSKDDKLIYRVFLGEFNTKEEAEDFQRMIKRKFKIESVVK